MIDNVKDLLREAKRQGWRVAQTRSSHYMLRAPDGVNQVAIAGTPSDHRAMRNNLARMRRAGFKG